MYRVWAVSPTHTNYRTERLSRRAEADNHQELPAGVREAAEILSAIESTGDARAAMDGPGGPLPSALSARRVRGSGCCRERRLRCLAAQLSFDAPVGLLGRDCPSMMRMLWAAAVRDPCPGSGWTGQPLWMRWKAWMRA